MLSNFLGGLGLVLILSQSNINIWNSKLQALGECTSTQDEESKESNTDFESLTMLSQVMPVTKFKTGVGSAMFKIIYVPSKLRSLFGVSCHNQSMELEKTAIYIALNFAT
ncbi:hypothetical protein H5410_009315 [Solanum commersonii]|uniref:Uncharacterized protein n=1 Tax=Solanum commersonii TaxID=4109 RepID=A0A9J6AI32_SOLCO|nr:hypothetical protein H5410_009315 [Solanum commersonii]